MASCAPGPPEEGAAAGPGGRPQGRLAGAVPPLLWSASPPAPARRPRAATFPPPSARPPPPAAPQGCSGRRRSGPCGWGCALHPRRLRALLRLALSREERLCRAGQLQAEICDAFERVLLGFLKLENIFNFSPDTFNLALTILHRLVVSVKIKERLLPCVTMTSLRLAVKINEEEELIPHVKDFIQHYGSGYTPSELLRMELAILDRLHWDLHIGTPLDFLTIFHSLVVLSWPHVVELLPQRNPSLHVASLTRQLQHCMVGHQLLQFKGSTLALVITTLELERLTPGWWTPTSDLLKKAQVSTEEYSRCRELVKQRLGHL